MSGKEMSAILYRWSENLKEVKGKPCGYLGKSTVGKRNSRCKALEAEACLAHSRISKEDSRRGRVREEERA